MEGHEASLVSYKEAKGGTVFSCLKLLPCLKGRSCSPLVGNRTVLLFVLQHAEGDVFNELLQTQLLGDFPVPVEQGAQPGLHDLQLGLARVLDIRYVLLVPFSVFIVGLAFFLDEGLEFVLGVVQLSEGGALLLVLGGQLVVGFEGGVLGGVELGLGEL